MSTENKEAVASNAELGGAIRYCYSTDEETFFGSFETREQAIAAAAEELIGQDEAGETRTVWTGVQEPATKFLDRSALRIAEHLVDFVDEWLAEDIMADDQIITIDDMDDFGSDLVALLKKHGEFRFWNAGEIQAHGVTVPGDPDAA